jgi:hypothetical protein
VLRISWSDLLVGAAYKASTSADLDALRADLPVSSSSVQLELAARKSRLRRRLVQEAGGSLGPGSMWRSSRPDCRRAANVSSHAAVAGEPGTVACRGRKHRRSRLLARIDTLPKVLITRQNSDDGQTQTRTGDTTIFSRVLYQLSYLAAGRS